MLPFLMLIRDLAWFAGVADLTEISEIATIPEMAELMGNLFTVLVCVPLGLLLAARVIAAVATTAAARLERTESI